MSTPVQSATPPRFPIPKQKQHQRTDTGDLQKQMQFLIDLQYEQQQLISGESRGIVPVPETTVPLSTGDDDDLLRGEQFVMKTQNSSSLSAAANMDTNPAPLPLSNPPPPDAPIFIQQPPTPTTSFSHASFIENSDPESVQQPPELPPISPRLLEGVGQGVLLFRDDKLRQQAQGGARLAAPSFDASESDPLMYPPPPPSNTLTTSQANILARSAPSRYGALDSETIPPPQDDVLDMPQHDFVLDDMEVPEVPHTVTHESLYRSFCFGAIDGLLTGTGIVAALLGLDLVSLVGDSHRVALATALLVTTTCLADALCMALGHVWTTHLYTAHQAEARRTTREELSHVKESPKGQLVDMLLSKGMLKIDAMSLADTLEGYPDLFVSVLCDETLQGHLHDTGPTSGETYAYSCLDPEQRMVAVALHESRLEGLCMLVGFALLGSLPGWVFLRLSRHLLSSTRVDDATTQPITMFVMILSCVMWLLGIWKSRFIDSQWLVFSVETVIVLWICFATAWGSGSLLRLIFLEDDDGTQVALGIIGEDVL